MISLSFRFVAASRKKSFHISVLSHNAETGLQSGGASFPVKFFSPPLKKCAGRSLKLLDVVHKMWAPLRKLFAPPGVPSWLRACSEVKLCNLYQFAEAFNGIATCKIVCPFFMFHHFTINCIWLMLFLHELKQILVLVKQFSFINRNVSLKQILLTWFNIFSFSCLQTEESRQSI